MHRLMGACVSRQLPENEAQQQQQQQQQQQPKRAKSPKRSHSYGFGAFKSPWRRQQQPRRPLSSDSDNLAASYATASNACNSAPPQPDRRPVLLDNCSPSGSPASEDLQRVPVRSVTIDNFIATADQSDNFQAEPSSTTAVAQLCPSLRSRLPAVAAAQPAAAPLPPTPPSPPAPPPPPPPPPHSVPLSPPAKQPSEDRPDTVTTYSEVCASTDNESQASALPMDQAPLTTSAAAAGSSAAYRRSRLTSGASSLDSDDLMLGTDCDTDYCDMDVGGGCGDDDTCGGASLTTSRAGADLADCLIREEEEYELNQEAEDGPAPAASGTVGSLMTASLPPDSLARHLRRQQQPPLSLSLAAGAMRFRPRSVSSPQGDLLLLPGAELRYLAHDVTGVKTLLLRLRRQLLDDGRASLTATPTGCCDGGGGSYSVCQLCGSDAQRIVELEDRIAKLQAEVEFLRRLQVPDGQS